jgi:ParB-like chromosome segregation protein Spo0J
MHGGEEAAMTDNVITPGPDPDVSLLAISGFRRDERLWPRRGLDEDRVRALQSVYEQGGPAALPPLLVVTVEKRGYLADGWQRCAAAGSLGWTALPALVKAAPQVEDVYLEALAAVNDGDRPLSLTRDEKRAAVDRLLQLAPRPSDHAIARMAGVSQPFVSRRRHRLETGGGSEREEAAAEPLSRREGGKIIAAAGRLLEMERTPWLCTNGESLDPAAALREAAATRGPSADVLLERLQRWVERARRDRGDPLAGAGP